MLAFKNTTYSIIFGIVPSFLILILYMLYKNNLELFKDITLTLMNSLIGIMFYFLGQYDLQDNQQKYQLDDGQLKLSQQIYQYKVQLFFIIGVLLSFQSASLVYMIQIWYFKIISISIMWASLMINLNYEILLRLIYLAIISYIISIWYFYQDFKLKKLQFYFLYNIQMEQEGWQKLVNQNLPCPVLVVKENEEKKGEISVVFQNKNTKNEFKRIGNVDINWVMNNIYVNQNSILENSQQIDSFNKANFIQTIKDVNQNQLNDFQSQKIVQPLEESQPQQKQGNSNHYKQSLKSSITKTKQLQNQQSSEKNLIGQDFITFQKFELAQSRNQGFSQQIQSSKVQNQIQQSQEQQQLQQIPEIQLRFPKIKREQPSNISARQTSEKQLKFLNIKSHFNSIVECNKDSQAKQNKNDQNDNKQQKYAPLKELIIKKIENYRNAKSFQSLNNLKNQNTNYLRLEKEEYFAKCILNVHLQIQKDKIKQEENAKHNEPILKKKQQSNQQLNQKRSEDNEDDHLNEESNNNTINNKNINCNSYTISNNNQNNSYITSVYNQNQNINSMTLNDTSRKESKSSHVEYYEMRLVECIWENELCILILMTNISDKIKNDFYKEINHYKDDLINTVTHDLKTPLNGIISILESAISLTSFNEMQKCIQIARKNGVLLTAIINDIQDFQNMKKGEFKLNPQKFNLNELMIEIKELIEYQAKSKGIEFKTSISVENTFIYNDFNRIKQIVLNLIGNALKFTFKGYVFFEITQLNNQYLKFAIADTGIGISTQLQKKIFQPYGTYQQKKNYQHGCGIGLAICQKLVQKVGNGNIELISKEGQGSTFIFLVHRFLEEQQTMSKYQLQESLSSLKKIRALGESFQKQQQLEIQKKKEIMFGFPNCKSQQHLPSGTLSLEILEGHASNQGSNKIANMRQQSGQRITSDINLQLKQNKMDRESSSQFQNIDSQFKQLFKLDKKINIRNQKNRSQSLLANIVSEILPSGNECQTAGIYGFNNLNQSNINNIKIQQSQIELKNDLSSQQLVQRQYQLDELDINHQFPSDNRLELQNKVQTPLFSKFKFIQTIGNNLKDKSPMDQSNNSIITQDSPVHSNNNVTKDDSQDQYYQQLFQTKQSNQRDQFNLDKKNKKNSKSINNQFQQSQQNNFNSQLLALNNPLNQNITQNIQRKKGRKITQSVLIQNNTLGKLVFSKYKKILIVDDTGFNILALKLLLKQQISTQTEVFEAFNGRQALEIVKEKFRSQQYVNLILMDVNMPIMDGIEATRIIKNLVKEGKMNPLKIVMITAFGSLKDRENAKLAGADAYMEKPVTVNSLIAAIEQAESGQD
ncbi:ATPase, histidine kinase-, DNA gyrase B (macronuclear) [Tetrahymena thermophila SB210]|uniref:histidine kinase n=1 Tax=Tetrahymena thermophila (strain SB210) TaxID=312017 RepID=I7MD79_TETTS|nr:ATPase, histidine kinase-, DNA gyrase B [Tetrahymena thermophila SB210]EAR85650.2 ATPase, histidine kinase-, DNA gyrase B [Tetrahymena thermophila SB210]|eukprot:XP_001033313.2 ATPase, histidine kinase-, DNA gyrase B [Tetrahymena thermophila SB210]